MIRLIKNLFWGQVLRGTIYDESNLVYNIYKFMRPKKCESLKIGYAQLIKIKEHIYGIRK